MKKIAVIVPYRYLPAQSGGHRYIQGWLQALSKHAAVTVIGTATNSVPSSLPYRILPVLAASSFRYADFTLLGTIKELIARNQYDLLVWEHPYFSWLANQVKKETNIPYWLHTHNIEYQRFRSLGKIWWPLLERYEKWGFQKADRISFITTKDRDFAIQHWQINPQQCLTIPYGVIQNQFPADRQDAKMLICERHQIDPSASILLFNGPLHYSPNREALEKIIEEVAPVLKNKIGPFQIVICGSEIPKRWKYQSLVNTFPFIHVGLVADIENYVKAAQLLLNPVQKGGGVQTKIIEAIAAGTPVLTTPNGASGIEKQVTGNLLQVVDANTGEKWANRIQEILQQPGNFFVTPAAFYETYNWDKILEKIAPSLAN
jgi:glycosyltransferase involved in cell wall biosynthesis